MRHCPTEYPKKRPLLHAYLRLGKLFVSANVAFESLADIRSKKRDVRFTPKADIGTLSRNVRFVPKADIRLLIAGTLLRN